MKSLHLRRGQNRSGTTLLELVAASTIIAVTLVPALRVMRSGLRVSRQLEVRESMATVATSLLEQESARISGQWSMQTRTHRNVGRDSGYPSVIAISSATDSVSKGGTPGSLAVVTITAFDDANNTGTLDNNESSITFATKIARLISYRYEAQGS